MPPRYFAKCRRSSRTHQLIDRGLESIDPAQPAVASCFDGGLHRRLVSPLVAHLHDALSAPRASPTAFASRSRSEPGRLVEMHESSRVHELLGVLQIAVDVGGFDRHHLDRSVIEDLLRARANARHGGRRLSAGSLGSGRQTPTRSYSGMLRSARILLIAWPWPVPTTAVRIFAAGRGQHSRCAPARESPTCERVSPYAYDSACGACT